jgi:lysophospholipase L1-like esterase
MHKYNYMRIALVWLVVAMATKLSMAQVTNQNLYDTVPTMVDHYNKRLAEFKKETVEKGKIIFLGNSITEGGQWHQLTDNKTRINRGIGGDVTFGILNRLDEVISREPVKIFILIGINDISKDFPDAVIANNLKRIVQTIKAKLPTTNVYLQSVLPVNPLYPKFPQHYDKGDHVISVNKLIKELAISEGVTFVNLYPLFLDNAGHMDKKLTSDGLHLNGDGYKVWIEFLKSAGHI